MKLGKMLLVLAALAVHGAAGAAAQSLEIGLTRFYRSAGGQTVVDGFARIPLTALAAKPAASDLLLATAMRVAVGGDTTLAAGELRKGSAIVQAAVRPLLTPQQAQVGYYLEWYGGRLGQPAETAGVSVRILRADGTPVVATPAQQVPFGAGGGVTRAMIDLAGLPPGEYAFEVVVQGRDTTAARRAAFRMGGLESVALVEPPP